MKIIKEKFGEEFQILVNEKEKMVIASIPCSNRRNGDFKSIARCSESDEFSISYGIKLVMFKSYMKMLKYQKEQIKKVLKNKENMIKSITESYGSKLK